MFKVFFRSYEVHLKYGGCRKGMTELLLDALVDLVLNISELLLVLPRYTVRVRVTDGAGRCLGVIRALW